MTEPSRLIPRKLAANPELLVVCQFFLNYAKATVIKTMNDHQILPAMHGNLKLL